MIRRARLILTLAAFLPLTASAQRYADAAEEARIHTNRELGITADTLDYHVWHRPHYALHDAASNTLTYAYRGPSGDAYEIRDSSGSLLRVHMRVRGACLTGDGISFHRITCGAFLAIDADYEYAMRRHRERQAQGRI